MTNISKDDYIKVRGVDFGETGTQTLSVRVRAERRCALTLRIGSKTGTIRGKVNVQPTDGEWQDFECNLSSPIKNVCDIFFTFSGNGSSLMDFDSWQFNEISTGIKEIDNSQLIIDNDVYDLSGRKFSAEANSSFFTLYSSLKKGIYIVKGKKVVVK